MAKIRNHLGRDLKSVRSKDRMSISSRSSLMSKIKSKNTAFESNFIVLLTNATKYKFRTHVRGITGVPDIVFDKQKICVFLDSDFWHGWQFPRWKHKMKNEFWIHKISRNRKRDMTVTRKLKKEGWKVIRIWEHSIRIKPEEVLGKIITHLNADRVKIR